MPARTTRKTKLLERRRPGARSFPEENEAVFERSDGNDRGAPPSQPERDAATVASEPSALLALCAAFGFVCRRAQQLSHFCRTISVHSKLTEPLLFHRKRFP